VSLGIRAKHGAELVDVLNDLPLTVAGNHQLPNLRHGQELNVGVRLQLPAWAANQEITSVRLAWDSPEQQGRQSPLIPSSAPRQRRSISRVKCAASSGDSITSITSAHHALGG